MSTRPLPVLVALLALMLTSAVRAEEQSLDYSELWAGAASQTMFALLPSDEQNTEIGYINDPKVFAGIWKEVGGGEALPKIDFNKQMVVFIRNTREPKNILKVKAFLDDNGTATFVWHETLNNNTPRNKVQCMLLLVEKKGIHRVKGHDVKVEVKEPKAAAGK
jgi:hypothetical protein